MSTVVMVGFDSATIEKFEIEQVVSGVEVKVRATTNVAPHNVIESQWTQRFDTLDEAQSFIKDMYEGPLCTADATIAKIQEMGAVGASACCGEKCAQVCENN